MKLSVLDDFTNDRAHLRRRGCFIALHQHAAVGTPLIQGVEIFLLVVSPHVPVQVVPPAVTLLAETASVRPDGLVQFVHVPPQAVQLGERLAAHRPVVLHPAADLGAGGLMGRRSRQTSEVRNEGD